MTDSLLRPFSRIVLLAIGALMVARVMGGLLPAEAWLAWLSPVVHVQAGIRADEPDIFVQHRGLRVNLTPQFGGDVAPTWSGDGRMAWISNRDGDFDVYVREGARTHNLSDNQHGDFEPTWSVDGRLAWVSRERARGETVYVWDGTRVSAAGRAAAIQNRSLAWADDGRLRWLGLEGLRGAVYLWEGGEAERHELDVTSLLSLSWSPAGQLAWITRNARDERSLYLLDFGGDRQPRLLRQRAWLTDRVAWSPDEQLAWGELVAPGQFRVIIWRAGEQVTLPVRGFLHSLSWSQDGRLLWVDSSRAPIGVMRLWDGQQTRVINDDVRHVTELLWSRGGQLTWSAVDVRRWAVFVWDGVTTRQVGTTLEDALEPVWVERSS